MVQEQRIESNDNNFLLDIPLANNTKKHLEVFENLKKSSKNIIFLLKMINNLRECICYHYFHNTNEQITDELNIYLEMFSFSINSLRDIDYNQYEIKLLKILISCLSIINKYEDTIFKNINHEIMNHITLIMKELLGKIIEIQENKSLILSYLCNLAHIVIYQSKSNFILINLVWKSILSYIKYINKDDITSSSILISSYHDLIQINIKIIQENQQNKELKYLKLMKYYISIMYHLCKLYSNIFYPKFITQWILLANSFALLSCKTNEIYQIIKQYIINIFQIINKTSSSSSCNTIQLKQNINILKEQSQDHPFIDLYLDYFIYTSSYNQYHLYLYDLLTISYQITNKVIFYIKLYQLLITNKESFQQYQHYLLYEIHNKQLQYMIWNSLFQHINDVHKKISRFISI